MKKNIYINRDKSNCPITLEQLMHQGLISEIGEIGEIGEIHDVTSNDIEKKKQLNN
ncbi:MAG: hypothetical protein KIC77_07340 [Clostridiales bacterium]|nr:hypothetical protein [Clostridiales bacterium]